MKKLISILFISLTYLLITASCATKKTNHLIQHEISIKKIKNLSFDKNQDQISKLIGDADKKIILPKMNSSLNRELWVYIKKHNKLSGQRLSLVFDKDKKLISKTFYPFEFDPEKRINFTKGKYLASGFKKTSLPNCNPHSFTKRDLLVSKNSGIKVIYMTNKKTVSSITWVSPDIRAPSSINNTDCPKVNWSI